MLHLRNSNSLKLLLLWEKSIEIKEIRVKQVKTIMIIDITSSHNKFKIIFVICYLNITITSTTQRRR